MYRSDVDSLFSKWDKDDSPGCVLGVIQDGKFIYQKAYGMANLEHRVPLTSNSVFRIGSISKQFTAMCIALLAQRKKLSLDDSISKFIPEMPDYAHDVRIRHMIHHVSGIRSYTGLFALSLFSLDVRVADNITQRDTIEMIARQKQLNFKPGDRFEYSNSNYFLLGLIVERLSGKTLREFAEENIFKTLGMKNTHYHDDSKMVVPNRAYGYEPKAKDGFDICMSNCEVVGDGCVFTTVNDLMLWENNFYNNRLGGGKKLIRTVEKAGTFNNGEENPYAFGLERAAYKGLPLIHHGGAWAGFIAYLGRYPEQRISIIILANMISVPVFKLSNQVADIFLNQYFSDDFKKELSKKQSPKQVKIPEATLDALVGLYFGGSGMLMEVTRDGSNLTLERSGMKMTKTVYAPVSDTKFHPIDGIFTSIVEVANVGGRRPNKLIFHRPDGKKLDFESIPNIIPPKELKEFAGEYYSPELDTVYLLEKTKDKTMTCRTLQSLSGVFKVSKLRKDELVLFEHHLKFRRNKQGKITGFDLGSINGVSNIRFRKRK
jgi:CubicO group peptidase (beta-lactamase class C family)